MAQDTGSNMAMAMISACRLIFWTLSRFTDFEFSKILECSQVTSNYAY